MTRMLGPRPTEAPPATTPPATGHRTESCAHHAAGEQRDERVRAELVDRAAVACRAGRARRNVQYGVDRDGVGSGQDCVDPGHPVRKDPRPAHPALLNRRSVPVRRIQAVALDQGSLHVSAELSRGALGRHRQHSVLDLECDWNSHPRETVHHDPGLRLVYQPVAQRLAGVGKLAVEGLRHPHHRLPAVPRGAQAQGNLVPRNPEPTLPRRDVGRRGPHRVHRRPRGQFRYRVELACPRPGRNAPPRGYELQNGVVREPFRRDGIQRTDEVGVRRQICEPGEMPHGALSVARGHRCHACDGGCGAARQAADARRRIRSCRAERQVRQRTIEHVFESIDNHRREPDQTRTQWTRAVEVACGRRPDLRGPAEHHLEESDDPPPSVRSI